MLFRSHPAASELVVALGSRGVRFGGEGAVPFARFFGRRNRLKRGFELVLRGGVRRGKTENWRGRRVGLVFVGGKGAKKNEGRKEKSANSARTKKHTYFF